MLGMVGISTSVALKPGFAPFLREQSEQFKQSKQFEQFEQSEQREQREQYEQSEQFEQFEQYEQFEQFEQYEQYEQFEQSEQFLSVANDRRAASSDPQNSTLARFPLSSVIHVFMAIPSIHT